MNIIFDLSAVEKTVNTRFNGANEYTNAVIYRLDSFIKEQRKNTICRQIFFLIRNEDLIEQQIIKIIRSNNNFSIIKDDHKFNFPVFCKENQVTVYYNPMGNHLRKTEFSSLKVILTIHGLRALELPFDKYEPLTYTKYKQYFKFILKRIFSNSYKRYVIKQTEQSLSVNCRKLTIIVPSVHTQYALVNFLGISNEMINVLYSPAKPFITFNTDSSFLKQKNIPSQQYFLFISANRAVKNPVRLIKAFDELAEKHLLKGKKLVITGIKKDSRTAKMIRNKSSFILLDYVETTELELLYKNCFAFLYPSLNEGFGYPAVEAMKYGKPVITSAISSIPELLNGAALFFNPFSSDEIKNRILQLLNDTATYDRLSAMSFCRYENINRKQKEDLEKLIRIIIPEDE